MKMLQLSLLSLTILFFIGCGGDQPGENQAEATEHSETKAAANSDNTYTLDPAVSSIGWYGSKKFTEKEHNGTIALTSGQLAVDNGNITSGEFTVDMNSIDNSDMSGSEYATKLEGHLKSADFFDVAAHPTASFAITSTTPYEGEGEFTHTVTGNMTIKGISKEISFPAKVSVTATAVSAAATFTINRADWDVQYGSESFFPNLLKEAKDNIIKNEITLTLGIVATQG